MEIKAEISGTVTVSADLPPPLLRIVKAELTFPNPKYVNLKKMGKYCRHLSPTLQALEEDGLVIRIPRGYGRRLHALAQSMGSPIVWTDRRVDRPASFPQELIDIHLRDYQMRAVKAAMGITQGVVVSPTGSGKTMTAMEIIRRRGQKAVVLVHNRQLLKQWRQEIKKRMGLEAGIIGDGQWVAGSHVTVAMLQTLGANPGRTQHFAADVGLILADECHHSPADSFAVVIGMFPAKYRYGFTATPERKDGLGGMIHRLLGDTVATVEPREVLAVGGIVPAKILAVNTGLEYQSIDPDSHGWTDFVDALATDAARNRLIVEAANHLSRSKNVLVLTERVQHAETLAKLLPGSILVHGKRKSDLVRATEVAITVGTKGLLGEGIDISIWSALVMASPMSGKTPVRQAVGRVIRPAPGKTEGVVVDFVDSHPFAFGSWRKRRIAYQESRWPIQDWDPVRDTGRSVPKPSPIPEKITGKRILALDLGQHTGWALLLSDGTISSGTEDFRPGRFEGGGMTFLRFSKWLDGILIKAGGRLDGIWFEAVMAHAGTIAAQTYGAFHGRLTAWCEEKGIPYQGIPVGTIKKHATGNGGANKDAMIAAMKAKGHHPKDDNEADALAILHLAACQV
ncbi:MAG: DEAD/DEAH box helicase family protein [Magnetococcales bacterium]|nr:DEAD/DEAH box helicase family protein [Magnetococcales bacterium]